MTNGPRQFKRLRLNRRKETHNKGTRGTRAASVGGEE
jgi:hypothetical protein